MATEGVELVAVVAQYYGQTSATPVVRECVGERKSEQSRGRLLYRQRRLVGPVAQYMLNQCTLM